MPSVTVQVRRESPGSGSAAAFDTHQLEAEPNASVLDLLFALQRGAAPDLAFRFSCRVGMCGSCAMVVNGREQLTCSVLVKTIGPRLRIEPLRNCQVIRDLVPDLTPFFQAYQRVAPHFVPKPGLASFYSLPQGGPDWKVMDHQPQCIDCGCCYSACTLVTLHPKYIGPMALHRALTLITDPRESRREERLKMVSGEDGSFRCHTLGNCREACPRGISPTASIQRLKRLAVADQFRALFRKLFGGRDRSSRTHADGSPQN